MLLVPYIRFFSRPSTYISMPHLGSVFNLLVVPVSLSLRRPRLIAFVILFLPELHLHPDPTSRVLDHGAFS